MHPLELPTAPSYAPRALRSAPILTLSRGAVWIAVIALLVSLQACGQETSSVRTIENKRVWTPVLHDGPARTATTAERFRFTPPALAGPGSGLHWETPAGWTELPNTSLRQANFRVAADERAECYLTMLDGGGGGLLANVNRWRKQISLPEIGESEMAALPRASFFGGEGVLADFEGTYTGMGGDEAAARYRLVGLALVAGGRARFLKMTGPADLLAGEMDAFLALAASFHEDSGDGHDHGESAPAPAPTSWLAWEAPAGWTRGPARMMREVTFSLGEGGATECYVVVLGGAGGGAFSNVNRWRAQMNVEPLSMEEFEALERIGVLATDGIVVEVAGDNYEGMAGETIDDALLLGLVCELPERAVFVKMIGPSSDVRAARNDFLQFCRSLKKAF